MASPKSLAAPRPARRMDAWLAAKRLDLKPGIVGERRQARGSRRGVRLQSGILDEALAGLLRLRQPELARRHRLDAEWREQIGDLAHLAFIVAGDDEARASTQRDAHLGDGELLQLHELGDAALGERHQLRRTAPRLKARCSAVPCTSTMPPEPGHHEIGVGLRL